VRGISEPLSDEFREHSAAGVGERPLQQQDRQWRVVADGGDDDVQTGRTQPLAAHRTTHPMQNQLDDRRHHLQ